MRLHNRQIKASFWTDADLTDWPLIKRLFYLGLIQLADDSGCLEWSARLFKRQLFPLEDVSVEQLAEWTEEMLEQGKLIG